MWWKKWKKQEPEGVSYRSRVSTGIQKYIQEGKKKVADYLNHKTQGFTRRGKKYFLVGFCILFGGLSLYQLLKPFITTESTSRKDQPAAISVPAHINKTGDDRLYPDQRVSEEDFSKVREFRLYMDSLQKIPNGKEIYDSILAARPGLMDTVLLLEQLYYQQKK